MADIAFEDLSTWPEDILETLHDSADLFRNYFDEQREIDAGVVRGEYIRQLSPPNSYWPDLESLRDKVTELLYEHYIIGYHATRLTTPEITRLADQGLIPLSGEFLSKKITQAVEDGILAQTDANPFLEKNSGDCENRTKMIWFVYEPTLLQQEDGFDCLLGMWGGEALYRCHDEAQGNHPVLSAIGKPCIIKARIPISILQIHGPTLGGNFIDQYLKHHGMPYRNEPDFEDYVTFVVEAKDILDIITPDIALFEELTDYKSWDTKIWTAE